MGLIFLAIFFALSTTNFGLPSFTNQQNQPLQATADRDCSYELEKTNIVQTTDAGIQESFIRRPIRKPLPDSNSSGTGDDEEQTLIDVYKTQYGNNRNWVLVKRDAPIIAYKVTAGAIDSSVGREMDVLGTVIEEGEEKWAFISLGHCKILTGSLDGCWDPVTLITLYVLQQKGTDQDSSYPGISNDGSIPTSGSGYTPWVFNVYVAESLLITNGGNNYSTDDLPCWMSQCLGGDLRDQIYKNTQPPPPTPTYAPYDIDAWNRSCPGLTLPPRPPPTASGGSLGESLAPGEAYPPSFIRRDWVDAGVTPPLPGITPTLLQDLWSQAPEYAFFVGKLSDPGFTDTNSIQNYITFIGKLGNETTTFDVSIKKLGTAVFNDVGYILKPKTKNIYYLYILAEGSGTSSVSSLKLGTFTLKPGFVYEWWYPSCKPVVYLYPERETSFDVKLKPFGILTDSIPSYPFFSGWKNVLAKPNGDLTYLGKNYDYLYYEGRSFFVKVPKEGFIARGSELSGVFDAILPQLSLNDKEIADFKEYWLGRLNETETFYAINILPRAEIDRVEPMELNPNPDTLIRIRLFFKKLDEPELLQLPVLPQTINRSGTTVVDWGGFFK